MLDRCPKYNLSRYVRILTFRCIPECLWFITLYLMQADVNAMSNASAITCPWDRQMISRMYIIPLLQYLLLVCTKIRTFWVAFLSLDSWKRYVKCHIMPIWLSLIQFVMSHRCELFAANVDAFTLTCFTVLSYVFKRFVNSSRLCVKSMSYSRLIALLSHWAIVVRFSVRLISRKKCQSNIQ